MKFPGWCHLTLPPHSVLSPTNDHPIQFMSIRIFDFYTILKWYYTIEDKFKDKKYLGKSIPIFFSDVDVYSTIELSSTIDEQSREVELDSINHNKVITIR